MSESKSKTKITHLKSLKRFKTENNYQKELAHQRTDSYKTNRNIRLRKNRILKYIEEINKNLNAIKDWSVRFNNFEDVIFDNGATRQKKIDSKDVLSKEDVNKLVKGTKTAFYKAFILVQYEGALRTKETRELQWSQIEKENEETWWLNITSYKNRLGKAKERTAPPLDIEVIYWLKELKKKQKIDEIESKYVFPAPNDSSKPVSSETISKWFRRLTKKVLGKNVSNYILRHSKGEEFHKLVREGKMSKENAVSMMGHSEKMFDKTYSHADEKERRRLLKEQVLHIDAMPPERKNVLEEEVKQLKTQIDRLEKFVLNNLPNKTRLKDIPTAYKKIVYD